MRLKNRVAVVTGGGMGIGKAIAVRFAEEGAVVRIGDINEEAAKKTTDVILAKGHVASYLKVDVSRSEDMKDLMESTENQHGRLDILVNNAGIAVVGGVLELDEDQWDTVMRVNLKSVFLGAKYAIPIMKRHGGGSIINMGSASSLEGFNYLAAYAASKGGIHILTRCLALDHAKDHIRVNCICPGLIDTTGMKKDQAREKEEMTSLIIKQHPLGRRGRPEEVAHVAVFLASDESAYMTGSALSLDGGYHAGKLITG
jgi:meso-butanediol dehydrogenase / (S,S)-butanediol dehydrogenase / diacetyl reductase